MLQHHFTGVRTVSPTAGLDRVWTVVTDVINDLLDTFPNTVHTMLNIEPQIEKIVLHLYKTIQKMKWS